jgi:hypothetical protein
MKPKIITEAMKKEAGSFFQGIPERWLDARPVLWRCEKGHVSHSYLKCEEKGAVCFACETYVYVTFPEDKELVGENQ